jgi:hypothetical protein
VGDEEDRVRLTDESSQSVVMFCLGHGLSITITQLPRVVQRQACSGAARRTRGIILPEMDVCVRTRNANHRPTWNRCASNGIVSIPAWRVSAVNPRSVCV